MVRIWLHIPGRAEPEGVDLAEGESLLVGREPAPDKLASLEDIPALRTHAVPFASISANHLLLWQRQGCVYLRDLGSRNGSWLELPRGGNAVSLGTSKDAVSLRLAGGGGTEGELAEPSDARWTSASDYGTAVATAIREWFARSQIGAEVLLRPRAPHEPAGVRAGGEEIGRIPLGSGQVLVLLPHETMDDRWLSLLGRLWRYVTRQDAMFRAEEDTRQDGFILASPAMRKAHRQVVEAARRGARALLVLGPTGAGKEQLARCFHRETGRGGPFVASNCAMLEREQARAELFGAEVGAYTGLTHRRIGMVERASGGTLFLDEIGDMPLDVQGLFLRFLESGEYERMNSNGQLRQADIRLVCATHVDLRAASLAGSFRRDMWYRLSVHVVDVPPLCERPEDLLEYLGSRELVPGITARAALLPEALEVVLAHRWEGNFRELINFVARLPLVDAPGAIDAATCRDALLRGALGSGPFAPVTESSERSDREEERDWPALARSAAKAFSEDVHKEAPANWDEVKEYIEKYLKPLFFAHFSGAAQLSGRHEAKIAQLADRLDADRGTATSQLQRYFDRFR